MRTPRRTRLRNLARIALLAVAAAGLSACAYEGPYGYGAGYYSPGYYDWYGYPYYNYPYYGPDYGYFGFGFSGGPYWGPDRDRRDRRDYRTPERRTAPRPHDGIRPPQTQSRPPAGTYRAPPQDNRRRDYNNNS